MLSKLLDASHGASSRGYARRSFRSVRHGCTCVVRHHEPVSDSSRVDIRSVCEILAHHAAPLHHGIRTIGEHPLLFYERLFVCQCRPEVLGGKGHDDLRRLVTSTGADAMSSWAGRA